MPGLEQLAVQLEQNRAMQRAVEKSTPIAYEERVEVPSLTERLATYGLRAVNAAFEFGTPDSIAGGNPPYKIPKNTVLKKWMKQPCEDTLAGVDYTKVDDSNYQAEVFQKDVPEKDRKPVMALFYNNTGKKGSQQSAMEVRVLKGMFPQYKIVAFKLSDGSKTPSSMKYHVKNKYGVKRTPAIMFFHPKNGKIVNSGDDFNLYGGWLRFSEVKKDFKYYGKNIRKLLKI